MTQLKVEVRIEREHADLAAFVTVPAAALARWKLTATTTVDATLDGVPLGRRSLQRLDDARWFLELRREHFETVGKRSGEWATLAIVLASTELPAELQKLIDDVPAARTCWERRTDAQRRMLREHVLDAKTSATRERRARRALLPVPKSSPQRVAGLSLKPQALVVRILGRRLPGRTCGPYTEVAVGLPQKVGCDPTSFVSADAREAAWETRIEVRQQDGAPAFRGPAVNGPPRERFLYLTWIGRKDGAAPAMFRRAKLRLDAVPADVLTAALRSGTLVGRLELTASDGMPVCASVRPPAIAWSSS